jgi:hypothetical protein
MHTHVMKKVITLKSALLTILGISFIGLVGFNMRDSIWGTPLSISTVKNGTTITDSALPIAGVARHARELLINGRPITLTRDGSFSDTVLLSPGYNIVEVALKDQFGNQKVKTYHVVVRTPESVAISDDAVINNSL